MVRFFNYAVCLWLLSGDLAPVSAADFYRWVDQNGVIHFTDSLHNIPESRRGGASRIKTREPTRSAEPEPPPAVSSTRASVPIEKHGNVVVVEAKVNQKTSARFVVDTGASYTMISTAVAKELALDANQNQRTVSFQTANGVIQAPVVSLESIEVGGMEITNLSAAIHDVTSGTNVVGLLGLNFLSNFRMDIDTKNGVLHLEKR